MRAAAEPPPAPAGPVGEDGPVPEDHATPPEPSAPGHAASTDGPPDAAGGRSAWDALEPLAVQDVELAPGFRHLEVFTLRGLLTVLWHGDPGAERVVLASGGAMGGLLGPADGLYHDLGVSLAGQGIGVARIGYRRPNDLGRCVHDVLAVADLAARRGARRFVTVGHSFGGAVAVQAGAALGGRTAGVVGLATQSAGCEAAEHLDDVPLLLVHGEADELLPPMSSELVRMLAGHGELVVLPGVGHLLTEAADGLRPLVGGWLVERLAPAG